MPNYSKIRKKALIKLGALKKTDKILWNIAFSALVAVLVSMGTWSLIKVKAQEQFDNDTQQIKSSIQGEVKRYEALLLSVRSFLAASTNPSKAQFDSYVSSLSLDQYPALDILGFSQYVEQQNIDEFYNNLKLDYAAANELTPQREAVLERRQNELNLLTAPGHVIIKYVAPNSKTDDYIGWPLPFPQLNRKDYEKQFSTSILINRARGILTHEAQNDQIVSLRAGVVIRPQTAINIQNLQSLSQPNFSVVPLGNATIKGGVRINISLNDTFFKHLPTDGYLKYQIFSPEEDGKALVYDNRFKKEASMPWPKELFENKHIQFKEDARIKVGEREFSVHMFSESYPPNVESILWVYGFGIFTFLILSSLIHFAVFKKIEAYVASREATKQVEQLSFQANNDELTGLQNRRSLFHDLNAHIKMYPKNPAILFFVDLDGFKYINDNLGHQSGDNLLIQYASRLRSIASSFDKTIYRIGGDEFVVLVEPNKSETDWPIEAVQDFAATILAITQDPFEIARQRYNISQSIGVAQYPFDAKTADEFVKAADTAMYEAKKLGKNQFVFYSVDISQKLKGKIFMRSQLQKAIDKKELSLMFQPKVKKDMATGQYRFWGAEALMRWDNSILGSVPPSIFIPLAEESGLIPEMDNYLIHEVGKTLQALKASGVADFCLAINVSARQFNNTDLPEQFVKALEQYGVRPARITIEITESATMKEAHKAKKILEKFRSYGFGVSIDDFGTGYSSINYLRQFPATEVKIDKSFTDDIHSDHDDRIIIEGIINMSQKLKLAVVVEGIETAEQIQWLEGVSNNDIVFQGYYFSKPLALQEFTDYYHKNK